MKKDDHGPEALGRFFGGYYGQYGKPATGARIHQASFSRGGEKPSPATPYRKSEEYLRPARHEKKREEFPKINDTMGAFLRGQYDDD